MKKLRCAAAAAALLLALTACGGPFAPAEPTPSPPPPPTPPPPPPPAPVANPLTGEPGEYRGKRPVAVTLRSGETVNAVWSISRAEVVLEGVADGYYPTRTLLFSDAAELAKVGPVGPAKDLLLQFTLPLNAVPVHIGKNRYASNLLNTLEYQDLDGLHIGKKAFAFDEQAWEAGTPEENCWFTDAALVAAGLNTYDASAKGENTPLFRFGSRDAVAPDRKNAAGLTIHWSAASATGLVYQEDTGLYQMQDALTHQPVTDDDTGETPAFTNVVVLFASSGVKDDGVTRQYDLTGGDGIYLTDGAWQAIRWTKGDATAPLALTDADGKPLTVRPGKSYLAVWGGYYGQSILLTGSDGAEQTLPDKPALLASGVSDEKAEAAEQEYRLYLEAEQARTRLKALQEELDAANAALEEAQQALQQTSGKNSQKQANAQAEVDRIQALIAEQQAVIDAAAPAVPAQDAPEQDAAGEDSPSVEDPAPEQTPVPTEGIVVLG